MSGIALGSLSIFGQVTRKPKSYGNNSLFIFLRHDNSRQPVWFCSYLGGGWRHSHGLIEPITPFFILPSSHHSLYSLPPKLRSKVKHFPEIWIGGSKQENRRSDFFVGYCTYKKQLALFLLSSNFFRWQSFVTCLLVTHFNSEQMKKDWSVWVDKNDWAGTKPATKDEIEIFERREFIVEVDSKLLQNTIFYFASFPRETLYAFPSTHINWPCKIQAIAFRNSTCKSWKLCSLNAV